MNLNCALDLYLEQKEMKQTKSSKCQTTSFSSVTFEALNRVFITFIQLSELSLGKFKQHFVLTEQTMCVHT